MHFVNQSIDKLTNEFHIQHRKTTPHHPQVKDVVKVFNNILENTLTKICNVQRDYWDHKIPTFSWDYRTTCKRLTRQTPFRLVYGKQVVIPLEYIIPSLRIVVVTEMTNVG